MVGAASLLAGPVLARPQGPPVAAKTARPLVMLDPGHGGAETGAVGPNGLREKDVNLAIAKRVAALLPAAYRVRLTRSGDRRVNSAGRDLDGNGVVNNDDDLQA